MNYDNKVRQLTNIADIYGLDQLISEPRSSRHIRESADLVWPYTVNLRINIKPSPLGGVVRSLSARCSLPSGVVKKSLSSRFARSSGSE